ncbi:MAG TPA: tetratricopeptide repeat protein [Phycisphaerae bacterium]|nr:tetratricopeptide repeat protein [Phycisphaerae bacterium]
MDRPVNPFSLPRTRLGFGAAILVLAVLAAYARTFTAPFIFDDVPAITQNTTIRHLTDWRAVLLPGSMQGAGTAGRPLINLSFAVNYAVSGEKVWSYHAFNLLVHLGAALTLFGIVRRTLLSPRLREKHGTDSFALALGVAAIWSLHPLLTESVSSVVQRTESVMGLFYLLTLYAFIRSIDTPDQAAGWRALAWSACALGMLSKEVMASAPLLVLLYDGTFVADTVAQAWRQRKGFYLGLALTWIPLALVMAASQGRGGTVGFGHGVTWWEYALTQCRAVVLYLRLSFWPHPLVLDYGMAVVRKAAAVWPQALLLLALGIGTLEAVRRRSPWGFLGAWFFAILAPSSSVVPLVTQTIAEHRMYLPLAAVVTAVAVAIRTVAGHRTGWILAGLAGLAGFGTYLRNEDYRSAETIWRDTIAKQPDNERAYYGLAMICDEQGRMAEAIGHYETALRLKPDYANAHSNLAHDLTASGRMEEAVTHYEEMARLEPALADPHIHLGALLVRLGRFDEAIREYDIVLRMLPSSGEDHFNLAQVEFRVGRLPEAISHYESAVKFKPGVAEMHFRLGNARLRAEQLETAVGDYREAVRLDPNLYEAQMNLAGVLVLLNRPREAVEVYERALQLRPGDALTKENLERARTQLRGAGSGSAVP